MIVSPWPTLEACWPCTQLAIAFGFILISKVRDFIQVMEQQTASSDDFQEAGPEEKESLKSKYRIDSALEDKICDLYDLHVEVIDQASLILVKFLLMELKLEYLTWSLFFVQRFEEDPGPQVRRLYEEVVGMWLI